LGSVVGAPSFSVQSPEPQFGSLLQGSQQSILLGSDAQLGSVEVNQQPNTSKGDTEDALVIDSGAAGPVRQAPATGISTDLGDETMRHVLRGAQGAAVPASRVRQEPSPQSKPSYAHLSCTDVSDPSSFWWTDRENMIGEEIEKEWDPLKLINTDRPDFTDVAAVVGNGVVQIESGYLRWHRKDEEIDKVTESVPNVLVRIGHGDRFEYRVKWRGYIRSEVTDVPTNIHGVEEGLSDVEVGFKWVVAEQEDLFPMQTVVTRLQLPVGSSEMTANQGEPGISYIINWQARRWWFFRINLGIDRLHQPTYNFVRTGGGAPVQPTQIEVGHDTWTEISQSFSSYMQISKRLGMFAEWFAFSRHSSDDDHADHFHNYGLYYYVTPDMQLDVRAGWRLGDHAEESFTAAGFSMRF
jgi:hypothetical protein